MSDLWELNREKTHQWMYSLIYPAVLGTMLVSTLMGYAKGDIAFGYELSMAVFLVFYYCSQHVENVIDKDSYTLFMLVSGILEVLVMLILFSALGVYESEYVITGDTDANWALFYFLLGLMFLAPVGARYLSNNRNAFPNTRESYLSWLSIIAAALCLIGYFTELHYLVLGGMYIVFGIYLLFFVFQLGKGCLYDRPERPE